MSQTVRRIWHRCPFSPTICNLKKKDSFGTIVFESDEDMQPLIAYRSYSDRWLLELVFNRYKNDECLDHTNVQNDFSVIGSEFINFIATTATCRILNKARDAKVLEDETYGDMMEDLSEAWRKVKGPADCILSIVNPQKGVLLVYNIHADPSSDDEYWIHTLKNSFQLMEALGLSKPVPAPPKRKRGRPCKNASKS